MDMKVQTATGEAYGSFFPLLSLSIVFGVLLDLGINNYNNRKVAAHPSRFTNYFSSIIVVRFVLAILFTVVLLLIGILDNYPEERLILLLILGLNQVFLSSILYIRSNFTALGNFKTDSFFSVLDRILMICGISWFLFGEGSITIEKFVWVQFFGYLITFIASVIVLLILGKVSFPKFNIRFSRTLIKKSAPYAIIVLLMSAYNNSDSIMIDKLLPDGAAENSIYAQSFRVLTAMNNYAYLFAVLLLPIFSRMLKKKESVRKLVGLSGGLLIYGVSAFVIVTIHYRVDILSLCYGDYDSGILLNKSVIERSQEVYAVLIIGIIPMSFNYCYGVLITASGKMKVLNTVAAISLFFNLVLNYILIPKYGAYGAAYASFFTQSLSALAQVLIAYKRFELKFEFAKPFRFLLGLVMVFYAIEILDYHFTLPVRLVIIAFASMFGLLISVKFEGIRPLLNSIKKSNK
jgi:O-antigen/teichoic acid export membrane protein